MTDLHRGPISGLPDSLLADCILNMGKRGGGKSYLFRIAMERALTKRIRCGWIDAMGVGWGIAVAGDGKSPGFENVVVFGGEHGHLPITEGSGKAMGRTLARAVFSWVLDLKSMPSKASRVRFMADFIEAIYENCDAPLLLFLDEVDLWAPQMILDKQGPSAALLGGMHELVRRGRVKGLSVWMATQRPAEVSKGIISQADALLTFKLMAPQDLDAAMAWMKGHVGKVAAAQWGALIPTLQVGEAIVYLTEPHPEIKRVQFPLIQTLDTFRPPKKGERQTSDKAMASVDLEAIREQIGDIETELKANDPAELKRQLADLRKQLSAKPTSVPVADSIKERSVAYNAGWAAAVKETSSERKKLEAAIRKEIDAMQRKLSQILAKMARDAKTVEDGIESLKGAAALIQNATGLNFPELDAELSKIAAVIDKGAPIPAPAAKPTRQPVGNPALKGDLKRPQQRIVDAVAWWASAGNESPSRAQVAGVAGYSPGSGGFNNLVGGLGTAGLLEVPSPGALRLTDGGRAAANEHDAPTTEELHDRVRAILSAPHVKLLNVLVDAYPDPITRDQLAERAGYSAGSGGFNNLVGKMSTLEIVEKPAPGSVRAAGWLFLER